MPWHLGTKRTIQLGDCLFGGRKGGQEAAASNVSMIARRSNKWRDFFRALPHDVTTRAVRCASCRSSARHARNQICAIAVLSASVAAVANCAGKNAVGSCRDARPPLAVSARPFSPLVRGAKPQAARRRCLQDGARKETGAKTSGLLGRGIAGRSKSTDSVRHRVGMGYRYCGRPFGSRMVVVCGSIRTGDRNVANISCKWTGGLAPFRRSDSSSR